MRYNGAHSATQNRAHTLFETARCVHHYTVARTKPTQLTWPRLTRSIRFCYSTMSKKHRRISRKVVVNPRGQYIGPPEAKRWRMLWPLVSAHHHIGELDSSVRGTPRSGMQGTVQQTVNRQHARKDQLGKRSTCGDASRRWTTATHRCEQGTSATNVLFLYKGQVGTHLSSELPTLNIFCLVTASAPLRATAHIYDLLCPQNGNT
jgi:hypothetical protein